MRYHLVRGSFLPLLSHQAANDYILSLHPSNDLLIAARSTLCEYPLVVDSACFFFPVPIQSACCSEAHSCTMGARWYSYCRKMVFEFNNQEPFSGHRQNYTSSFSSCISRVLYDCRLVLHSPLLICKWFNVSIPIFSPACSSFTSRSHHLPRQTHISSQEMRPLLLVWMLVVPFLTLGAAQDLTLSISWKASTTSLIHSSKC